MAQGHDEDYEDRYYSSSRDSDDSPLLSYRYKAARRARTPSPSGSTRRSTVPALAKFFLFCSAMIVFCALLYLPAYSKAGDQVNREIKMNHTPVIRIARTITRPNMLKGFSDTRYIPVYNNVGDHVNRGTVAGWSMHVNRDTKVYVQPNNLTTIHEPKDLCTSQTRNKKNNLFLLIIISSATTHFNERLAIRQTWGHYKTYLTLSKIYNEVRERYKHYNYTYDLTEINSINISSKVKRDTSIKELLPEIVKALQKLNNRTDVPEAEEPVLDEEYDDETNVMRIPLEQHDYFDMNSPYLGKLLNMMKNNPKLDEDSDRTPVITFRDVNKIIDRLRKDKQISKEEDKDDEFVGIPDFKLMFILGMPAGRNNSEVQSKIEEEAQTYGDVLQEGFVDSYNNLTLKSIMMLKWVTNKCNESVRYILKTDDDMYINVPALMLNLKNRSQVHDRLHSSSKEYLLIGDLICGATPIADKRNKWYSPQYMYAGKFYPRYLSGTGYALSAPTAAALYKAALYQNYFHLEDIYITGMCALHATPPVQPRDDPMFSYVSVPARAECTAHAQATAHRLPPRALLQLTQRLLDPKVVDECERKRLTQVRRDRMRPKPRPKPPPKKTPFKTINFRLENKK